MQTVEEYFSYIVDIINQSDNKALEMECITPLLKEKYGDNYDSNLGILAKEKLRSDDRFSFFSEGVHIDNNKFYYSAGSWISLKDKYENVVKMKRKIGIEMWETKCK